MLTPHKAIQIFWTEQRKGFGLKKHCSIESLAL